MIISAGYRIGPFEVESALVVAPRGRRGGGRRRARRGARRRRARGRRAARRPRRRPTRWPASCRTTSRRTTAPYKYPRVVDFAAELPKTASGKVEARGSASSAETERADRSPAWRSPLPADESARMASLRELAILDTAPEQIYDDVVALRLRHLPGADRGHQLHRRRPPVGQGARRPRELRGRARGLVLRADDHAGPTCSSCPTRSRTPPGPRTRMVAGEGGLRFYAGAPIVGEDGHAVGSVCVADQAPRDARRARSARRCGSSRARPRRTSSCAARRPSCSGSPCTIRSPACRTGRCSSIASASALAQRERTGAHRRRAVLRPRRLQVDQRPLRPRRRRCGAARRRRPHGGRGPRRRHRRPAGGRRARSSSVPA